MVTCRPVSISSNVFLCVRRLRTQYGSLHPGDLTPNEHDTVVHIAGRAGWECTTFHLSKAEVHSVQSSGIEYMRRREFTIFIGCAVGAFVRREGTATAVAGDRVT